MPCGQAFRVAVQDRLSEPALQAYPWSRSQRKGRERWMRTLGGLPALTRVSSSLQRRAMSDAARAGGRDRAVRLAGGWWRRWRRGPRAARLGGGGAVPASTVVGARAGGTG